MNGPWPAYDFTRFAEACRPCSTCHGDEVVYVVDSMFLSIYMVYNCPECGDGERTGTLYDGTGRVPGVLVDRVDNACDQ